MDKPERSVHFENGVNYDWHYSTEFNGLVREFHKKHCLQPRSSMKEAKKLLTECLPKLRKKMKESQQGLCTDLIFTGSSYEGVKVRRNEKDDDLEFDIMVVMDVRNNMQVHFYSYRNLNY